MSFVKMNQSDKLRKTIGNNPIASIISKDGEKLVQNCSIRAVARLKQNYSSLKLIHRMEPNIYCRCGCNEPLLSEIKTSKYSDSHCQAGCGKKTPLKIKGIKYNAFCSFICKSKGKYLAPTSLSQSEINKKLSIDFNTPELEIVRSGGAGISPDGGIVFLLLSKTKTMLIVGAVEHKYQGTNDRRAEEGLSKQATGNAIERSYKNLHVITNYMRGEDITPYHIYIHGCDFEDPTSTIPDRATSMTNNYPFNMILSKNNTDKYGEVSRRGSVFELWKLSEDQLEDNIYNMYDTSVKYYLNKYVGEFDATC